MRIRRFLTGLVLATLLAWVCLVAILKYFDPTDQNSAVLFFLYLFLFVALAGTSTLFDYSVRRITQRKKSEIAQLKISLRQALLLALVIALALYWQSQGILKWWSLFLLILAAILYITGFQVSVLGLLADIIGKNRKLIEDILYRIKKVEIQNMTKGNSE